MKTGGCTGKIKNAQGSSKTNCDKLLNKIQCSVVISMFLSSFVALVQCSIICILWTRYGRQFVHVLYSSL